MNIRNNRPLRKTFVCLLIFCLVSIAPTLFARETSSSTVTPGPNPPTAPRLTFEHLSVGHGLSHFRVDCILQDSKGFMWFGTRDGLNRYDGYAFKVYRPDSDDPHSISGEIIQALYEDRKGMLWIGT